MDKIKVLSLGWGVQSFTLAAMSAVGEIEKIDLAIHSDTTHERSATYEFARKYTSWLAERGVEVQTVSDKKQSEKVDTNKTDIPAFTISSTGKKGMLRRQCTHRWKIVPMRRYLQKIRQGRQIEQWIGISTDEALRMKESDVKYITHRWPLIEKGMSRNDCKVWLENHGLEIPPRSACVFCPYHDMKEWHDLQEYPKDYQKAIAIDQTLRKKRPPYDLFVHPACIPLEDVDLRTEIEKGQMTLWDEECTGLCGV